MLFTEFFSESNTDKRPHILAVVLGLFSPVLAVVAVTMSCDSNRTAREALEINRTTLQVVQRAYLNIENVKFSLKHPDYSDVPQKPGQSVVRLHYQFTLNNLGNTPAFIEPTSFITRFTFPDRWTSPPIKILIPGSIGPRSKVDVDGGMDLFLADSDFKIFVDFANELEKRPNRQVVKFPRPAVFASSHFVYHDMFKKSTSSEHIDWCWTENMQSSFVFPNDCNEGKFNYRSS